MKRGALLAGLLALAAASAAVADERDERGPALFQRWAGAQSGVSAFEGYLAQQGVQDVVPSWQLLRTASDWRRCRAEPFAVPPRAQWPDAVRTLRLLRLLRERAVLGQFEVVSAWRGEALNRCAQGAPRSAHVHSFAVDLLLASDAPGLCGFWKSEGQAWAMGLSRYPSGRIHIDTAGYRTWGADHSQRSASCR
ncbi:D-Ala-D-Ala carboxypeptidase family metallohydrolase [Pseudomonas massiliensis]|uniref:D-Ala-D-Ala carboxypeptidase family metallohydrolase n=1 Tax=Pseudomonas massiliensis TaxID=522492 RepID=UPI00059082DC|nr:D-Ala-D-Ala carboxypeptidase family metallohydrolase [Pseudomonas massiliensis]